VIQALRRRFPGSWVYRPRELYTWWNESEGWGVAAFAALAPRYDGDDDSFRTEYRSSRGDLVPGLGVL